VLAHASTSFEDLVFHVEVPESTSKVLRELKQSVVGGVANVLMLNVSVLFLPHGGGEVRSIESR